MAQVGPLSERPLDGSGIAEVRELCARTTGTVSHGCEIRAFAPVTDDGRAPREPSLVLAHAPVLEPVAPASTTARDRPPIFEYDGAVVRCQVRFRRGTSFYGTGEVAGPLERTGRSVMLWNTDAWCYGEETPALYQSHPFVLCVQRDGSSVGLLADAFRRGAIRCASDGVELQFEDEPFVLYRIEGDHPAEVVRGLAALVGTINLPPLWALGYHQCRWSYASAAELRALASEFRARGIPCDALWLDIDHMDRFRTFTWDRERFPDPPGLTRELRARGFRTVAIQDPGIAADPRDPTCASGLEGGHFVQSARGRPARGRVWPGTCYFPDFTREETRAWWAERVSASVRAGALDGLWNDMNEPSVFHVPSRTLAEDCSHRGAGGGSHGRFHNLYGRFMVEATHAGLVRAKPEARPFLLTRSNHLGGARFAATWTGDNHSRWEDLRWAIAMTLNLGLSGQPFAGPDAGGFAGQPDEEQFVRWFELCAYLPFFRGHAQKSAPRKEPWALGPVAEAHVRAAVQRRMRLLPTLYALFKEAQECGLPVVRPLFFADPSDAALRGVDDAFLLGDALLVAPVLAARTTQRFVRLPRVRGGWFRHAQGGPPLAGGRVRVAAPLGSTPVFARAGTIVIEESLPREHTNMPSAGLTLHVYLDDEGRATGRSYEDEGDGIAWRAGRCRDARLYARWSDAQLELEEELQGDWPGPARARSAIVYLRDGSVSRSELRSTSG
jgi:alpha-glucosidase